MSADFRSDLLASGLLVDSGVAGLYARSGTFEKVVRGLDDLVERGRGRPARPRAPLPAGHPEGRPRAQRLPALVP